SLQCGENRATAKAMTGRRRRLSADQGPAGPAASRVGCKPASEALLKMAPEPSAERRCARRVPTGIRQKAGRVGGTPPEPAGTRDAQRSVGGTGRSVPDRGARYSAGV